jgi:hypothetical protein
LHRVEFLIEMLLLRKSLELPVSMASRHIKVTCFRS